MRYVYTVVGESYDVTVFSSFSSFWKYISRMIGPFYLDEDGAEPLTKEAVVKAFEKGTDVRVWFEDRSDWSFKLAKEKLR